MNESNLKGSFQKKNEPATTTSDKIQKAPRGVGAQEFDAYAVNAFFFAGLLRRKEGDRAASFPAK